MTQSTSQTKPWWSRRWAKAIYLLIVSLIIALIAANLGGFPLFLIVAILSPVIGIMWLIDKSKRRPWLWAWVVYTGWWLAGYFVFESFTAQVRDGRPDLVIDLLIGSEVPRLITSILLGFIFAAAGIGLLLLAPTLIAIKCVLTMTCIYQVTFWQALWLVLSLVFGIKYTVWIVENGECKEAEPKGTPLQIGGPGLVVIRPYNAVVFEQAGRVTRIEGPGEVRIKFDERIREVVDLRLQGRPFEDAPMLTRDRVPLKVTGGVGFIIERTSHIIEDPQRPERLNPALFTDAFLAAERSSEQPPRDDQRIHRDSVYKAVYNPRSGQKWQDQIKGDAESEMRKVIRTYDFRDIYDLDPRSPGVKPNVIDDITKAVTESLKKSATRFGVQVLGVSLKSIRIEEMQNIQDAYFAALGAEWRKRMALTEAEAERQAFRGRAANQARVMALINRVLGQFRQALTAMAGPGQPLPADVIDRYLQVAERLLQNAVTDHSTARRYLETMETFARVSPNTVIAAGIDISEVSDFLTPGLKPPPNEPAEE